MPRLYFDYPYNLIDSCLSVCLDSELIRTANA
jgi:hypothetical protein